MSEWRDKTRYLIYKRNGPVEPGPDEPAAPRGELRSVGHVLVGSKPPFSKYAVYVDDDGVIWARLHQTASDRMRIGGRDSEELA